MDERLKVLVAEDDDTLQRLLVDILPHDVSVAADGEECMEMLKQQTFDVLLLDIMLPKVSGVALIRALKEEHPEIAVVAMTGFADAVREQILAMGVDAFVEKPFERDDVLSAIQRAMGRKGKRRQGM